MKKFMKVCGITALILLVLGVAMGTIASAITGRASIQQVVNAATGGRIPFFMGSWGNDWDWDYDWNWRNVWDWDYDQYWDEFDENSAFYDIDEDMKFDSNYDIMSGKIERYTLGSNIKNMEIEAGGCVFYFEPSRDDNFYVEAQKTKKFQCYTQNDTLFLRTTGKLNHWEDSKRCNVTLYVPKDVYFDMVDIDMGAGKMEIDYLAADTMKFDIGAGQIEVDYLKAKNCDFSVGMGEITVDDMRIDQLMSAEVDMGHLSLYGDIRGDVDATCSMGTMELNLTGREKDFNYRIAAAMGNIMIDGREYTGLAREKVIENAAAKNMQLECNMGGMEIYF